jgi:hypothetical protein
MEKIEKWGLFEVSDTGIATGNPFTDCEITGIFTGPDESVQVRGFYYGDGVYKVRFMPSYEGKYSYEISGNYKSGSDEVTLKGEFEVTAPSDGNHGSVRVKGTHLAYEDGSPYYSIGTTCYAWVLQGEERRAETFETLKENVFNKIRFCIFPKHYLYNLTEPCRYPYEKGNGEGLVKDPKGPMFPPVEKYPIMGFNYYKPNPDHFKLFDDVIEKLCKMGIEADIIIFHPYDRWGFAAMDKDADDLYLKYVVARYAAYRNVWWSFANEYDLMSNKEIADWERYAEIVCKEDPYNHLRGIHHCTKPYDSSRPWITHLSSQRVDLYRHVEYTDHLIEKFGKPVVWDEIAYEGNIGMGWGNISGQELTRRFWEAFLRGGYAGHGETFEGHNDVLWWSHGGKLYGESPERFKFLLKILKETPGTGNLVYKPGMFDETIAEAEGAPGYTLHYFGFGRPSSRTLFMDPAKKYEVELIDTWNMTIEKLGTFGGMDTVPMPGREYMALRLKEV